MSVGIGTDSNSRLWSRSVVSPRRVCGHHMSHGCIEHCWIVPPTLNGNASLGQHSMGLHMEVQHVRVCGHSSHVYVCVCVCAHVVLGRRVASVASSCVLCVQLLVTSPNRTGSHALLIQSPPSSRAIEPISQDTAPCRALAHPLSWILFKFRNSGTFWHKKAHVKTDRSPQCFFSD